MPQQGVDTERCVSSSKRGAYPACAPEAARVSLPMTQMAILPRYSAAPKKVSKRSSKKASFELPPLLPSNQFKLAVKPSRFLNETLTLAYAHRGGLSRGMWRKKVDYWQRGGPCYGATVTRSSAAAVNKEMNVSMFVSSVRKVTLPSP